MRSRKDIYSSYSYIMSKVGRPDVWRLMFALYLMATVSPPSMAADYNLRLRTDNVPDFTDIESLVHSVTDQWQTPQEKCIAIWSLNRQSRRQTSCATEGGRLIWDPILHYNSYGTLNCGIVSSLNSACWKQLGYKTRYIQLGDHTVCEVSWDGGKKWHMFDSSMSFFCYNHDGEVASCKEIEESHACELSGGVSEPGHYYLYHGAPQCVSHLGGDAWRKASDRPVEFDRTLKNGADSFTDGFEPDSPYTEYARYGHRYRLGLLPHQTYTRFWQPLELVPAYESSYAAIQCYRPSGGKRRDPKDMTNMRGNGMWDFEPIFDESDCTELFYQDSKIELRGKDGNGPKLHPTTAGELASVVFEVSAANVITSLRISGAGYRQQETDHLRLLVSRDAGINWQEVWKSSEVGAQEIRLNLLAEVAGVTECLVKVEMMAVDDKVDAGLDSLKLTTVTQLNRRTLPKLTLGSNLVTLTADEQAECVFLWPMLKEGVCRETLFEHHNLHCGDGAERFYAATLGPAENGEEGYATWRIELPTDVTGATIGVVATNKSSKSYVAVQTSFDGLDYREILRKSSDSPPYDKQEIYEFDKKDVPAGVREFYVRSTFKTETGAGTYNKPGLQDLSISVQHEPRNRELQPVEITYHWIEHREAGDVERSHTEIVESMPHEYKINTAGYRDPTMLSVRMRLANANEQYSLGYSDDNDVGGAYEQTKVVYAWGKNLAFQKPYSTSRPSSEDSRNPDTDGTELTNGKIIAATPDVFRDAVQPATAFWSSSEAVTFIVDLGEPEEIAGVRVSTHQPNDRFCHPAEVRVATSTDGETWHDAGIIKHADLWNTSADYEPWEHDDDPEYDPLPARGRLAYSFPLVIDKRISGRFVRFTCHPQAGHGMGLAEFQVFDDVRVTP